MPGYILHRGAKVICAHGGQAMPVATIPLVTVSGQPVATQLPPYSVAGCGFVPPGGNGPCATANWTVAAMRVKVYGQPVLTMTSKALCVPTGTPLTVVMTQIRVQAL